jgi:hypothetical protein
MHCVGSKVQFTGPRHGAVIEPDLSKESRVGKRGEYPGPRRVHQPRQLDGPCKAICKDNPQPKLGQGMNGRYAPGRSGHDLLG